MSKERNYWLDTTKFILIFLVILWHCDVQLGRGGVISSVTNTSMSFFRMPLFIFLSGYFSKKIEWKRFCFWVLGVLETYVVFTLIQLSPGVVMGKKILIRYFIEPRWTLWYLVSLCLWRGAVQLFTGKISPKWLLVSSVILGLLSGFVNLGATLSLQRTFSLAPFFVLGTYCSTCGVNLNKIKDIPIVASIIVLITLWFGTYYVMKDFPLMLFLKGRDAYESFIGYPKLLLAFMRFCQYIICVGAGVCVLRLIPTNKSWFSAQGRDTLFYYVYHPLLILLFMQLGRVIKLPGSMIAVLLYAVLITASIYFLIKIPFFRDLPRLFSKAYARVFSGNKD